MKKISKEKSKSAILGRKSLEVGKKSIILRYPYEETITIYPFKQTMKYCHAAAFYGCKNLKMK